jgi:hypothetical protein
MLCHLCRSLVETMWLDCPIDKGTEAGGFDTQDVTYPHHQTYRTFQSMAQQSCYICHGLQLHLRETGSAVLDETQLDGLCGPFTIGSWTPWNRHGIVIRLSSEAQAVFAAPGIDNTDLGTLDLHSAAYALDLIGSPESNTTEINACGTVVRRWLETCINSHPICAQRRTTDWYPTRLLDLGDAELHGSIKLIHTQEEALSEPYVTLSHCWGGVSLIKLTTTTLPGFKLGIQLCDLPQTFRDAVKVALFLGVRYLWIDALTILQDSIEDWVKEASLMGHVYKNSLLNIGATASRDSQGGLFFHRNASVVTPPIIQLGLESYVIIWRDLWHRSISTSPLCQRGWVTQERWICPRMLHFGTAQLFWECLTMAGSEATPERRPPYLTSHVKSINFKFDDGTVPWGEQPSEISKSGHNVALVWEQWDKIVWQYSGAKLTFEEDKLVAISGIARIFQERLNDEYIAGLWWSDLVFQLGWRTVGREVAAGHYYISPPQASQYIAPSWSWASFNGRAMNSYRIDDASTQELSILAEPLHYYYKPASLDKLGQVAGASVHIRAPLHEVSVSRDIRPSNPYPNYKLEFMDGLNDTYGYVGISIDIDSEAESWPKTLICLPLFAVVDSASEVNSMITCTSLLLRREPGSRSEPLFSRVGIVDAMGGEFHEHVVHCGKIESLPDEAYTPEKGYTIKII